jgi:cytochrome bd ubiquinol oxidase subunit I
MNYPIWEIDVLGGPWLIGVISCVHIFVSHFAVGGGIFFAVTESIAKKENNSQLYAYLKQHSKFFMLLTTVFGAVTGVGIWFAISLVSPDGTHVLIQNYTLGWATEYLFFVAEIATIFVYYYTWDRVSKEQHLLLAKLYAIFSILTLVIINGILTFMLTPGAWLETGYWGHGFFNSTYWPSLIMRLIIMVAIAGMYALLTAARLPQRTIEEENFRTYLLRYASKWFIPLFFLGPLVAWWYFSNIPNEVINNIFTGIQSSGVGNFSILARVIYLSLIVSGTILIYVLVGPFFNPKGFSFYNALMFMICGLLVTSVGEWSREMLRKPYVIYGYMYSNGLLKSNIEKINDIGFIKFSKQVPNNLKDFDLNNGEQADKVGEIMFKQQCMACHTIDGYRSIIRLIGGERDEKSIKSFLEMMRSTDPELNPYLNIMPPVVGHDDEIKALAKYLNDLVRANQHKIIGH